MQGDPDGPEVPHHQRSPTEVEIDFNEMEIHIAREGR